MKNRHISRRQFLMTAGSSFLALPPLLSLMSPLAVAQVTGTKKIRSVLYCGSLGIDPSQIFPAETVPLTPVAGAYSTYYKKLNTFTDPISRIIDPSFAPMYPHMNLMKGLSLTGGLYQGHNGGVLCGSHSGTEADPRIPLYGKSIDVIMEQSANVYPAGQSIGRKAIRLQSPGFSFDRVNGTPIKSGTVQGDRALFNLIFESLPSGTGGPTPLQIQNQTNRKLIVDQVYADLKALESNSRISREDKNILDRYVSSVHELQQKIIANNAGLGPSCSQPSLTLQSTTSGNYYQFPEDPRWGITNVGTLFDNYLEMIRLAFACDLTRVVYIGNAIWSDSPVAVSSDGGLHHECASSELAADRQKWGLLKMLKLAQMLQSTTDPFGSGATLLDNSSILFTNELGSWTTAHSTFAMPAVMFGSAGGFFKTGNYVDYTQLPITKKFGATASPGRPYKQLMQSIMQSMGVPKSEYMQFGDGNGFGEFKEGINQFGKLTTDTFKPYANEHNDLLPFVT